MSSIILCCFNLNIIFGGCFDTKDLFIEEQNHFEQSRGVTVVISYGT